MTRTKLLSALLASFLLFTGACADIEWPASLTSGQAALRNYVDTVNLTLTQQGGGVIDMAYEMYPAFASLGMDGADAPETAEIAILLGDDGLHSLTLRICDAERFEKVASACLAAASSSVTLEKALELTGSYADVMRKDQASGDMTHSFEEPVDDLQGDQPRAYFAYFPNQFGDGNSWLQMTLIFARLGSAHGELYLAGMTPAPSTEDIEYEGFFSEDNFSHLEIFATPTPEPDSAAMEGW